MENNSLNLDDFDIDEYNKRLTEKLSKEPHLEKINNETWYINPLTGSKKIILDENDNFMSLCHILCKLFFINNQLPDYQSGS